MFGLGMPELGLISVICVFFFGAKKFPELAKGVGEGLREFQSSLKGKKDN